MFFRKHRSAKDMIELSSQPFDRFIDAVPEVQLRLISDGCIDIHDDDIESDCGSSSCEAF